MNVTAPYLPAPTLRCDEIARVLDSLQRAEEAVTRFHARLSTLRLPRRRHLLRSLLNEVRSGLNEVRAHLRRSDIGPAVAALQRVGAGLMNALPDLPLSEEIVRLSPGAALNLGRLLPGLGLALCGPTVVNSLCMATRARAAGEGAAALAWSLQASLEGLAEAIGGLQSMFLLAGAPGGASLQIALLVLQVGCGWSAEIATPRLAA